MKACIVIMIKSPMSGMIWVCSILRDAAGCEILRWIQTSFILIRLCKVTTISIQMRRSNPRKSVSRGGYDIRSTSQKVICLELCLEWVYQLDENPDSLLISRSTLPFSGSPYHILDGSFPSKQCIDRPFKFYFLELACTTTL